MSPLETGYCSKLLFRDYILKSSPKASFLTLRGSAFPFSFKSHPRHFHSEAALSSVDQKEAYAAYNNSRELFQRYGFLIKQKS